MQETGLAHGRLLDTDAVESPTFDGATGRSSAWLERWLWGSEVAGSNPAAPTPPAGVALLQALPPGRSRDVREHQDVPGRSARSHPRGDAPRRPRSRGVVRAGAGVRLLP